MSFSSDVKQELCGRMGAGRHCQLAELAVLFAFDKDIPMTEHPLLKRKYESLATELLAGEDPFSEQTVRKLLRAVKMCKMGTNGLPPSVRSIPWAWGVVYILKAFYFCQKGKVHLLNIQTAKLSSEVSS